MKKIKSSELFDTGGGVIAVYGELDDGSVFISDDTYTIVGIFQHDVIGRLAEAIEKHECGTADFFEEEGEPMNLYWFIVLNSDIEKTYHIRECDVEESYEIWREVYEKDTNIQAEYKKELVEALEEWRKSAKYRVIIKWVDGKKDDLRYKTLEEAESWFEFYKNSSDEQIDYCGIIITE